MESHAIMQLVVNSKYQRLHAHTSMQTKVFLINLHLAPLVQIVIRAITKTYFYLIDLVK
jgi:hypothetical protein